MNKYISIPQKLINALLLTLFSTFSFSSTAKDQYISISYQQLTIDFFGEESREFQPSDSGIGYGIDVNDEWSISLNYQRSKGNGRWFSHSVLVQEFYESGETESEAYGLSVSWQPNDHGVSFYYSNAENTESSVTYLPFLVEGVTGSDQVLNIAYIGQWMDTETTLENLFNENQNYWAINWGLGLQNIDSEIDIIERLNTDQPVQIDINLQRQSLSVFAEVELAYIFINDLISWSPYLNLSWDWELDVSGEEYILLSRGERSITFEQSGALFNNQIRTPDAGTVEFGVSLFWNFGDVKNGQKQLDWSLDLGYSESLDAEIDYSGFQASIRVDF